MQHRWLKNSGVAVAVMMGVTLTINPGAIGSTVWAAASSNEPAVPKLSEAQALALVKTTFTVPEKYTLQNENYNQGNQGNAGTYNFNYQMQNGLLNTSINVTVDANSGTILNYNQYDPNSGFTFPAPVSEMQAKAMAITWAKKLYPDKMAQVKLMPLTPQPQLLITPTIYTYNFERMIHGIPVPFDGFSVAIDQNGNLSSVNYNWTTQGLPAAGSQISTAHAESLYKKSMIVHLAYVQQWVSGNVAQNILAYVQHQPNSNSYFSSGPYSGNQSIGTPVINALTGKLIDSNGSAYVMTPYKSPIPLVAGGPIWPAVLPKVNWTRAQSFQYAQHTIASLGFSLKDLKLSNSNEYGGGNNDDIWNFSWSTPQKVRVNVGVDATYGYLNSFNQFSANNKFKKIIPTSKVPQKVRVTQTQALALAKKDLISLFPNDTGGISVKLQPNQNTKFGNGWWFNISALVNGIPYQANSGNMTIDWNTGGIQNLNWMYSLPTSPLSAPSSAISAAKAQSLWLNMAKLQLEYIQVYVAGKTKTELVYAPILPTGNNLTLDATSGQFLYAGYPKDSLPYSGPIEDLQGVPGAAQIQVLADRDLIAVSPMGKVNPQQVVTLGDFIQLLTAAFSQNNSYNPNPGQSIPASLKELLQQIPSTSLQEQQAIGSAYQLGWLPSSEPLQLSAPLTRVVAAEILARVLDLSPLLSHATAFSLQATDLSSIPANHYAAVALAVNLGLIPLQNGAFNPSGSMNLSDEAIATVETATVASQMHLYSNVNNGMGAMG